MAGKASPEAINRMILNITKYLDGQQRVVSALQSDYASIGEEWSDKQYDALGNVVDQAVRDLSSPYASLLECVTRLQLLKSMLEDYLSVQV